MSAAAPSKKLADAKAKRQKQILVVGSVILLALLGFELPKMLGGGASAETAAPATTSTNAGLPGSALAVAPGALPDTDRVVITLQAGQLLSFGLFRSKDPFVQQLSTKATPAPTPEPAPTTPVGTPPAPDGTGSGSTTVPTTTLGSTVPLPATTPLSPAATTPTGTSPATTPAAPTVAPTSVPISTNGACEMVALNGTFPGDEDIFRVVWIARNGKSAKISVVGGAYDSGQAAATLELGEKLTLVNTADGTRYVILLKAKCDVETSPVQNTTTTTTTTITTPATTTSTTTTTATTPIVTDSLDTTTSTTG
jgi:hypothetical protein